jgi:hypothetical protein
MDLIQKIARTAYDNGVNMAVKYEAVQAKMLEVNKAAKFIP